MAFRKFIFWLHLAAGSIAGIVILIMSVTGFLLAYERQINAWADGSHQVAPASTRVPLEDLLGKVFESQHSTPTTLTILSDSTAPVEAALGRERGVLVNPYTGEVLADTSKRSRGFFQSVENWHRTLGAQGDNRPVGRAFTGAANLAFLCLVVSGPYLWWPRKWGWARVKTVVFFKSGLKGRARDWNWHNVIGIWSALPLLVIVSTGVVMSYPWANALLYHLTGNEPIALRGAGAGRPQREGRKAAKHAEAPDWKGLNAAWTRAEQQVPGWKSITVRLPSPPSGAVAFVVDTGDGGQPQKRSTLTLNRHTGQLQWEPFSSYNLGRRLRNFVRYAHTGELGGVIGQTIAGVTSAGVAALVITGLLLALRRFLGWKKRRRTVSPALEEQLT